MNDYPGNVLIEIERAIARGDLVLTLSAAKLRQIVAEVTALTEKCNDLVRLNFALAERIELQSQLLSAKAERQ